MVRAVEFLLVVFNVFIFFLMLKQLYFEEVINRVILFIKFELKNNIYLEYDFFYREGDFNGKNNNNSFIFIFLSM